MRRLILALSVLALAALACGGGNAVPTVPPAPQAMSSAVGDVPCASRAAATRSNLAAWRISQRFGCVSIGASPVR